MEYFSFQWHITEAYDQRCKHCYIYALGSHAKFKMMTVSDMRKVLDNIETFGRKADRKPYLYITGGDPILHPQFWTLVGMLKDRDIPFTILGNPSHLNDDVCKRLKNSGCHQYQLSLDGLEAIHDHIRHPGSFKETLDVIPVLQRNGIPVAIMATVSRWNYKEVPPFIDVVVAHHADVFAFARYCPDRQSRETCCSPEEYHWMMEECSKKFQQYKDSYTHYSLKDHLWTLFKYERELFDPKSYPDDDIVYDGCNCGNGHFTILSDGACYACRRMKKQG